jgi:hypothetical protein
MANIITTRRGTLMLGASAAAAVALGAAPTAAQI